MEGDPKRYLCATHLLETAIVIEARKGPSGGRELDLLLHRAQIQIVNLTAELAEAARDAWRQWGKGNHRAGLNYCDCCAYALSKQLGEPLLFKGEDFRRTDVDAAVA
jgi:ribonuclease VapC